MFRYSPRSLKQIDTLHIDLQVLLLDVIKNTPVDICITEGYRTKERQYELYKEGKSQIDGINKKGMHNYKPARAFDFCAFVNGKATWDTKYLDFLAGIILGTSIRLAREGKIEKPVVWGLDWNSDGNFDDTKFKDRPHIQLHSSVS